MSQVEVVALWAGLISSIAGIVLSIVAMVFAIWVNNRATDVNNQMIRSLQKIESSVERVSTDTRELITAGWNKMLGAYGHENEPEPANSDASVQISSGLASEVQSELLEDEQAAPAERIARLEQALEELQATIAAQLRRTPTSRRSSAVDSLTKYITELPVEAKALLSILTKGQHLDRRQYRAAVQHPVLKLPIRDLRSAGFLVPLQGFDKDDKPTPVYHLAPGMGRELSVASQLAGQVPAEVLKNLLDALRDIGYTPRDYDPG